jgi:hypothetical protein
MASLSVSRRTSLVAGPLGTLPRFGETTCARDAVVARISNTTKLHTFAMPKAVPLDEQGLSEPPLAPVAFVVLIFVLSILCMVSLFPSVGGVLFLSGV